MKAEQYSPRKLVRLGIIIPVLLWLILSASSLFAQEQPREATLGDPWFIGPWRSMFEAQLKLKGEWWGKVEPQKWILIGWEIKTTGELTSVRIKDWRYL